MKTIFRLNALSKALTVAALVATPWVASAGIGNIRVQSGQGEPLSASVALTGEEAEAAVLNGAFSASGSVPLNVRVSGSQESPVLVITSSSPINEEITSLSVRAGDSVRLFSVALRPAAPKAEEPTEEQTAADTPKEEQKQEKKAEEQPKDNGIALGGKYTTKRKETVRSIAQRMTDSKASQNQKIQAIVDKNPHAFVNGNSARMRSGVTLTIPTADEIANIEKKLAEKAALDKAKKEAEAQAKAEKAAEEKAKKEAEAQAKAEKAAADKAQKEAEEKAKAEKAAAEKAQKEAEEKAKAEKAAAEKAQKEAEEKAKAEKAAAEKAQKEAEEKAQAEKAAAEKAQKEAEEKAQAEQAQKEAEAAQQQAAAEQAQQQAAAEQAQQQAEAPMAEEQTAPAVEEQSEPQKEKSGVAKYIAGGLLLLAIIAGFLLARRKGGDDGDDKEERPTFQPTSTAAGTVAGTVVKPSGMEEEEVPSLKEQVASAIRDRAEEAEEVAEETAEDLSSVELPDLDLTQPEKDETPVFEPTPVAEPAVEDVAVEEPISLVEDTVETVETVADTAEEVVEEVTEPQAAVTDIPPLETDLVEQTDDNEFVVNFDPTTPSTDTAYTPPEYVETPDNTFDFDFSENDLQHPQDKLQEVLQQEVQAPVEELPQEPSRRAPSVEDALEEGEKQKLAFDPNIGLDFILDDTPVAETVQSAAQDENYEEPVPIRQYQPAPLPRLDSELNISESLREEMATPVAEVPPVVEEPVAEVAEVAQPVVDMQPESEPETVSLAEQAVESVLEQLLPADEEPAVEVVEEEPAVEMVEEEPVVQVVQEEPPAPTVEEQTTAEESPIPVATEVVEETPVAEEVAEVVEEETVAEPVAEETPPPAPTVEEKYTIQPTDDKDAPLLAKLELAKMYLSQNDTEGTLEVLVDILDSCPPDSPIYKEAESMFNTLDT